MIVAGVMSGTSADGIDVAIVRIQGRPPGLRFRLLQLLSVPYPPKLRAAILGAMAATRASVPELARLDTRVSIAYAEAVLAACEQAGVKRADLIGCHGQTIFHQGAESTFLSKRLATTWQLGNGSRIAVLTNTPVVSDFRHADIAAGGRGAPLVPFFDFLTFRHRTRQRIALNIGGIANVTVIPPNASEDQVVAFDTGPGNMMIDMAVELLSGGTYNFDRGGRFAAKGRVSQRALEDLLENQYFSLKPPKSAGREEFGAEVTKRALKRMPNLAQNDVIATLTAFTAESIVRGIDSFAPLLPANTTGEVIASGGGTNNSTLMQMLKSSLHKLSYRLTTTDALGLPSQAKEAVAFAVLAYETWHRRPSNLPSATGAHRAVILGNVSYV